MDLVLQDTNTALSSWGNIHVSLLTWEVQSTSCLLSPHPLVSKVLSCVFCGAGENEASELPPDYAKADKGPGCLLLGRLLQHHLWPVRKTVHQGSQSLEESKPEASTTKDISTMWGALRWVPFFFFWQDWGLNSGSCTTPSAFFA
jgi:hypothetical protein